MTLIVVLEYSDALEYSEKIIIENSAVYIVNFMTEIQTAIVFKLVFKPKKNIRKYFLLKFPLSTSSVVMK